VVIEQLSGFELDYVLEDDSDNPDEFISERFPTLIFRLGLNEKQAEHFHRAWSSPPLDTPDAPTNFYILTCDPPEAWQSRGVVGPYVATADIPRGS